MILPLNLNRRHQVALFFTLVLAGIAALNGAKMMQVVGIFLLGSALAWAFGSDSRIVHWLFLSLGVLLTGGIVGSAWYLHQSDTNLYAKKVAAFEQRIPELAKEYPLRQEGQVIWDKDPQSSVRKNPKPGPQIDPTTGERVLIPIPPGATVGTASDWTPVEDPSLAKQARVTGLDLAQVPFDELPGYPPKPVWRQTPPDWSFWGILAFGIFLFTLGLGLILGIRAKPLPT